MEPPYLQYKEYMKARYGEPLFRVPIDFNFGCPHRDADGSGGCTFCNERGSRAVQTLGQDTVEEQTKEAIRFARERYGAKKFMAYIQAFSAYFGPEHQAMYRKLLDTLDFTAVSIGTRPDCLTPQAYEYLAALNREIETWVELGVQTVHERTLKRINRGHGWAICEKAINRLHDQGTKVIVHVILGLPGETAEHFRQTADTLAALPIDAVKIHNLHIERGTILAEDFNRKKTPATQNPEGQDSLSSLVVNHEICPLMEHEFAEHLMEFIRRMPAGIPILRLTTDTLDDELIAPRWHMSKGQFRDYVIQQMVCREWRQGDLCNVDGGSGIAAYETKQDTSSTLKAVTTSDGSVTFWNEEYREHYHTPAGARLEAQEKYIVPGKLKERLVKGDVALLDICFGLGYNSLAALEVACEELQSGEASVPPKLTITALEMDRRVVHAASENIEASETDSFDRRDCLSRLYQSRAYSLKSTAFINILWGDARHTVTSLEPGSYDIVFLDAFSTQRNSQLWTVDFFHKLKAVMKPGAILLTYCAALPVRAGLKEAGFFVGETEPVGRQRGGTLAAMRPEDIDTPLPNHELRMIRETSRGLPYRDPHGVWSNKEILRTRQERIIECKQEDSGNR